MPLVWGASAVAVQIVDLPFHAYPSLLWFSLLLLTCFAVFRPTPTPPVPGAAAAPRPPPACPHTSPSRPLPSPLTPPLPLDNRPLGFFRHADPVPFPSPFPLLCMKLILRQAVACLPFSTPPDCSDSPFLVCQRCGVPAVALLA